MLERADAGVGKILAALERHGLTRNTLVIFTNDNGGEWLSRNAPFFHRKGTLWEGGIRVPLIMRWPGELPAGKTSAQIALTMDITTSILAATRTKTPESYRPDGIDILPACEARCPSSNAECSGALRGGCNERCEPDAGSCCAKEAMPATRGRISTSFSSTWPPILENVPI